MSENIKVVSLIDRFLEHARIFHFHHGGNDLLFISSADWMSRNLDQRIELLVPVDDKDGKEKLMGILETYFQPNDKAYVLDSEGNFGRQANKAGKPGSKPGGESTDKLPNTQETFYQQAVRERVDFENRTPTSFTPHT